LIIYLLQGAILALSATIMPGPYQVYLISRSLSVGWKRALPAAFAPLITDGPIIALVLLVLTQAPHFFLNILRIAGGIFIGYLASRIFLAFRNISDTDIKSSGNEGRKSFLSAVILNALNPNPYIFWGVVGGPIVLLGWRESPHLGIGFFIGFYGTFVCSLSAFIISFATIGRLHYAINRTLNLIAFLALLGFGIYQMAVGVTALV
jgi:threonine/homoserine/homoserine lactone efflux protein